ncbi:hypothetical protein [Glutamicibacter sp. M10]|uniref:hypothetical protein n=1 Tax=Glutamicibacter sp. M10 TaxID=3023076 RepID=UPI0021C9ED5D|nr:hypothetical protein [Glutamicibacter sp. M10]UXN33181.1 hypothetical protein N6V40_07145 [Glutamicibacter sp. M10]
MSARSELKQVIAKIQAKVGAAQKLPKEWIELDLGAGPARKAAVLILLAPPVMVL